MTHTKYRVPEIRTNHKHVYVVRYFNLALCLSALLGYGASTLNQLVNWNELLKFALLVVVYATGFALLSRVFVLTRVDR